ncbi:hypothetical protein PPERSA_01520 [Pseudocohnilembus persalinus]|uniref:EF-hand domain-containing protein n=1 Tax=Pseudocohnilembus persalinus TaxID=266149 RepID=A0A0V0R7N1_PSEPJ|nr:hypothetical protein PPERSA_01520 [Pseudocohnilembus persalinus]|eukprot:KRX10508.1 hypothetical protein PPERSA_01520 [Pseudocohnilembus persalinus]
MNINIIQLNKIKIIKYFQCIFIECLSKFGVFLKKYEYQLIFNYFDKDKSGSICYNEFIDGIRMPLNERRTNMVRKVFFSLDRDGSGVIDLEEMKCRLNFDNDVDVVYGRTTTDFKKEQYFNNFDRLGVQDGKVTQQEFLDFYQDLGMSIANDDYFIELLEDQWGVTENDDKLIAQQESQRVVEAVRNKFIELSGGNKDDVILKKIFQQYDFNHDGYIGMDDFQQITKKFGIKFETKYLSLCFNKVDTHHSGFIEFDEFFDFVVHGIGFISDFRQTQKSEKII